MPPTPALPATGPYAPWTLHPTLTALGPSLQITADCWALLAAPDGTSRKENYLPRDEREPDSAYRKHLDAARPSGFFRDALRDGAALVLVLPPEQSWPREGDRQEPCAGLIASPSPACSLNLGRAA